MSRKRFLWNDERDALLKKLFPDVAIIDIALRMGCSAETVRLRSMFLGLRRERKAWSEADRAYLAENWLTSSAAKIAAHVGVSRQAVAGMASRMGLPRKRGADTARDAYTPRERSDLWTSADEQYLRDNHRTLTVAEMATALGRSRDAVYNRLLRLGIKADRASGDTSFVHKLRPSHAIGEPGSREWFQSCDNAFRAAIGARPAFLTTTTNPQRSNAS